MTPEINHPCPRCNRTLSKVHNESCFYCVPCGQRYADHVITASVTAGDDAPNKEQLKDEAALQKLCEQELSRRSIEFLHLSYRAREKKGYPDLTFCVRFPSAHNPHDYVIEPFAVELKTKDGRLSADQMDTLKRMASNGWTVRVIRSFESFVKLLRGIEDGEKIT